MRENRLRLLEQRPDIGAPVAHPSVQIADQQLTTRMPATGKRSPATCCAVQHGIGRWTKPKLQEALIASA